MPRPLTYILLAVLLAVGGYLAWPRAATEAAGGRIVLRVANWGGPGVDSDYMRIEREILQEWHRRHPDIEIRAENIPGAGQYVPKLLMTYVAGNPPDVMLLDASSAAVFIDNGLLEDLMPFVRADPDFRLEDRWPNVVDIARRGDHVAPPPSAVKNGRETPPPPRAAVPHTLLDTDRLYAIPGDFTPMVIVYNRRIFDEAGVAYPKPGWTRDEFLAAAKALTVREPGRAAPARYGFAFQKEMPMWFPWIWAGGGDVLSLDGRHALGYLDSPATTETVEFLADLVLKHRVAPSLSESAAAGVDLFRSGRAAMTMTGHWSLIEYRVDKMDIGVASIPTSCGRRVTVMYESGLAISAAGRHKQAAWEYVKYRTDPAVQRKSLAAGLAISADMALARSFAGNPVEDAFLAEVPLARRPWGATVERYELVEDLGREMIEDILTGGVPPREAVHRTAALIEAELGRQ